ETGLQFSFERRLLAWPSTFLDLGLLMAFIGTGAARGLADRFGKWTGWPATTPLPADGPRLRRFMLWTSGMLRWLATLALVAAVYLLLRELLQFPLTVARFYHSRAWGMTHRPFIDWFREYLLGLGIYTGVEAIAGVGLYLLFHF